MIQIEIKIFIKKVSHMKQETELNRLMEENDHFKKIIKTQQNTINRLIDYFILDKRNAEPQK